MICESCQRENAELHHAIYRSQSKIMSNMPINFVYLCYQCHRGDNGPHHNRKRDLELKAQVNKKLEKILCKEYYTPEALQKALKLSNNQLKQIQKFCTYTQQGYESKEVIFYLLGGRFYGGIE